MMKDRETAPVYKNETNGLFVTDQGNPRHSLTVLLHQKCEAVLHGTRAQCVSFHARPSLSISPTQSIFCYSETSDVDPVDGLQV